MTRVALVQLDSGHDLEQNLASIDSATTAAAARGARVVLLPEAALHRGEFHPGHVHQGDGAVMARLADLAVASEVTLIVGGVWLATDDPAKPTNTQVVIGPTGVVRAAYDKVHMFRLEVPGEVEEDEARSTTPGSSLVTLEIDGLVWGLSTCYDVRFPELYRALGAAGAQVVTVPSNFSAITGADHWEPLLRARAIENLTYVLAPAQCGTDPTGFRTHGRTVAIDPWGRVLGCLGATPDVLVVDIGPAVLDSARSRLRSPEHVVPGAYHVVREGNR